MLRNRFLKDRALSAMADYVHETNAKKEMLVKAYRHAENVILVSGPRLRCPSGGGFWIFDDPRLQFLQEMYFHVFGDVPQVDHVQLLSACANGQYDHQHIWLVPKNRFD